MRPAVFRRAFVLASLAGAASSLAQSFNWTNGSGSGFWNGTANWSPAGFPNSSAATATISLPGTYTVAVPIPIDVGSITIANPNATLAINPAGSLTLYSTSYTSDGPIVINSTGGLGSSFLRLWTGGTLGGTGDVTLNANPANLTSALLLAYNGTLTIPATRTVKGTGTLDGVVINNGTISADQPGKVLDMNPVGNFTNNNLVQAVNGGTLRLNGYYNTQTPTAKLSANGGTLILDSLNLAGGSIERTNGGTLTLTGAHDWTGVTLNATDLSIDPSTSITTYDAGGWTFNGPIVINSTGGLGSSFLRLWTGGTLGGTGDVTLNANPANLTSALLLAYNGTLTIPATRTVRGTGTLDGGNIVINGVIAPGTAAAAGEIAGAGPITFASGSTFRAKLAGASTGQFDRLIGSSTKAVGGTLEVTLQNGHIPGQDAKYDIITGNSVTGRFTTVNLPTLTGAPAGRRLTVVYLGNAVRLQTCYPNCDGSSSAPLLSAGDFVCFLNAFRVGDSYANCDGSTGSPLLSAADFVCFLNAFRAGCP